MNTNNVFYLSSAIHFEAIGQDCYVVTNTNTEYQYCINNATYKLLQLFNGERTLEDVYYQDTSLQQDGFGIEQVSRYVHEQFVTPGVLIGEEVMKVDMPKRKSKWIVKLAELKLEKLFRQMVSERRIISEQWILYIYSALFLLLGAISVKLFLFTTFSAYFYDRMPPSSDYSFFILFMATVIVHELGHIISAMSFKVVPKTVGIGLYFIFPVFFVNMSNIWKLKREPRVIVNLSGVAFELFFLSALLAYYAYAREMYIFFTLKSLFLLAVFNLVPFYRSDGYWIIADMLNEPNFHRQAIRKTIANIKGRVSFQMYRDWIYLAYTLFNVAVIWYMASFVINNYSYIINFPRLLPYVLSYEFIQTNGWSILTQTQKFVLPLILYIIIIKALITQMPNFFTFIKKKWPVS